MNPLEQFEYTFAHSTSSEKDTLHAMQKFALPHGRTTFLAQQITEGFATGTEQPRTYRTATGSLLFSETHYNGNLPGTSIHIATTDERPFFSGPQRSVAHIHARRIIDLGTKDKFKGAVQMSVYYEVDPNERPAVPKIAQLRLTHAPSREIMWAIWNQEGLSQYGDMPRMPLLSSIQKHLESISLESAISNLAKHVLQDKWLPRNQAISHEVFKSRFLRIQ